MRRNSYFIRIALLICLFTRILVAQNSDPSGTGYPENAVYHGGDLDSVQLGNGNLHLEIPIWSAKGRGLDTGAKFVYDSKVWTIDWYDGGLGYVYGSVNTRLFSKPNIHVENSSGYFIYYETGILDCEGISGGPFVTYSYSLIEPGGTVRKFLPYSMSYTAGGCNASATPGTFYADDGSGWMLQATSPGQVVAIRKDGLRVTLDTTVYDRNGNYIAQSTNNVTDTLGRSVSGTGSYVDSNGVSQAPQIAYTNVPVQSNLCQYTSGPDPYPKDANWIECHEYSATIPQVSSITLPGELPFTLEYTQNQLAEPSSMTLPTGGAIAWTWIDGNQYGRRVRTRSVDGNLWNYVLPDPNQNGMLSVVAPDLSHMDVAGDPVSQWKYYDSQNHLLKTVVTGFTSYSASLFNYIIYLPTSVTTTLADTGQVSKTETDYETFGYNVPGSNDYFPISSRNPLQIREYDWGAGTAGPLLRTTTFTYWHQQHASYRNNNVNDLVASSIVSGGSGPASKVLTYYDESFPSGRTGVPNHNCTGQPCASNIRGNPTTTSVWLDTTNTWLNTTRTFDEPSSIRVSTPPHSTIPTPMHRLAALPPIRLRLPLPLQTRSNFKRRISFTLAPAPCKVRGIKMISTQIGLESFLSTTLMEEPLL